MNVKKLNLQIEKEQAVSKKRFNKRVKQFLMLAFVSFPFLLWLGTVFTKAKLSNFVTIVIYCAILLCFWAGVLGADILISKRAKKLRQIKNAKAIIDSYNKQVSERRVELEKQANKTNQVVNEETKNFEVDNSNIIELSKNAEEKVPLNNNSLNDLQNNKKSVIISDIEKKQKIKQKKYGNFNNKRKK